MARRYQQVVIIGVSVGGVFALKLAEQFPIARTVVMSVPIDSQLNELKQRIIDFAYRYKKLESKSDEQIEKELDYFIFFFGHVDLFI